MQSDQFVVDPAQRKTIRTGALGAGAVSLLLANLGFLYFYFRFDLSISQVLIVFWIECFWIGVYSALKPIVASVIGNPYANRLVRVSRGASFCISLWTILMLGSMFVTLFSLAGFAMAVVLSELSGIAVESVFFDELGTMISVSGILFVGHGVSFIVHYLLGGEFRGARMATLLALPFRRCIALITAIGVAAGVLWTVPGFASTSGFALLLILMKMAGDYGLHRDERRSLAVA